MQRSVQKLNQARETYGKYQILSRVPAFLPTYSFCPLLFDTNSLPCFEPRLPFAIKDPIPSFLQFDFLCKSSHTFYTP